MLLLNSRLTMLLASLSHVFIVGSNAGYTMFRRAVQGCWLPTPFASFPSTSPPVRRRVPSRFEHAFFLYTKNTRRACGHQLVQNGPESESFSSYWVFVKHQSRSVPQPSSTYGRSKHRRSPRTCQRLNVNIASHMSWFACYFRLSTSWQH